MSSEITSISVGELSERVGDDLPMGCVLSRGLGASTIRPSAEAYALPQQRQPIGPAILDCRSGLLIAKPSDENCT